MKRNLKILFATDFSAGSKSAAEHIQTIQKKIKTDVFLIHAIRSFWKNWFSSGEYLKEARYRLGVWQQKYFNTKDKKLLSVKIGNPAEVVVDAAHKLKPDLLVLGNHLIEEGRRYKSGTCAEDVVRYAKMPVFISKSEYLSKMLCAIDMSSHSKKTLKYAIEMARLLSATLDVVYVYPSFTPPFGMDVAKVSQENEKLKRKVEKQLKAFVAGVDKKGLKVRNFFLEGNPENLILDMAEDFEYELLVMGARGESSLKYAMLGSTASKVLRHVPCSLLVVR